MLIILPNIIMLFGLEDNLVSNEVAMRKSFPKIKLTSPLNALKVFRSYYNESYGLKKTYVNSYIKLKNVLKEDPIPNRVVEGKEGWLFLGNNYNKSLNNSFGIEEFEAGKLFKVVDYLKKVDTYLKNKNISFYVVVAADKNNIYQEKLPFKIIEKPTRLDALKKELKGVNVTLIDLSIPLIQNKDKEELYIKTDSHWNDYGAFIGYSYLIDKFNERGFSNIDKVSLKDFNIRKDASYVGDISKMINDFTKVNRIVFDKKYKSNYSIENKEKGVLYCTNIDKKLKIMMHHDSFSLAWMPFLIETFGQSIFLKNYQLDKVAIEKNRPDIVVFEIIERDIAVFSKQKAP